MVEPSKSHLIARIIFDLPALLYPTSAVKGLRIAVVDLQDLKLLIDTDLRRTVIFISFCFISRVKMVWQ